MTKKVLHNFENSVTLIKHDSIGNRGWHMKMFGSKKKNNNRIISSFHKANCQKPLAEKKKRTIYKLIKYGLLGIIIFGVIFELALEYIPGLILCSSGCLVFILKEMWDFIKGKYKSSPEYNALTNPNQNIWSKIETIVKLLGCIVIQSGEILLGVIILLIITGGTVWAEFHVNARLYAAAEAFIGYHPRDDVSFETESETSVIERIEQECSQSDTTPAETKDTFDGILISNTEPLSSAESLPVIVSSDTSESITFEESAEQAAQIEKARRMVLEIPTKDWSISNEEREQFLFTSGKYAIYSNWTADQAAVKLKAYIEEMISCQYPNYFDRMADQVLRNQISEASALDDVLVSSREKDYIITVRMDAYALYGKASLARLLAEDFHCYALAFQYYNGDRATITSYYLQSVKWLFEILKYADNSFESQIAILTSLRYRYNDIMTYSEPESEQWEQARLLADALEKVIKEYKLQNETASGY